MVCMTLRTTITLDSDIASFLNEMAGSNRSAYINQLLRQDRIRHLHARVAKGNEEEAAIPDYGEPALWDSTLEDGL